MSAEIEHDWSRAIGRLEGKVDMVLSELARRGEEHAAAAKSRDAVEQRITARLVSVERKQHIVAGATGLFGFLLSTGIALMGVLPK